MNKLILTIGLLFSLLIANGQISKEAWNAYTGSKYQEIENKQESDATIIFDRTYLTTNREREKVEYITTIHRKIKINSLHGLKQFNKLYIPIYSDFDYNIEFLDCKAKTHKKGQQSIRTDTSGFVKTTLPANIPFYYKKDGNVKMLALSDINIGDQIEYIYALKTTYNVTPEYFYKSKRENYSGRNYCLEKSIMFDTKGYEVNIWPYNFTNKITKDSDFTYSNKYGEGHKVILRNIKEESNELYSKKYVDDPYITYIIFESTISKQKDTWSSIAKDFKPRRSETKQNYIFDGEKMVDAYKDLENKRGIKNKYKAILKKINQPLEYRFRSYTDVKDDIDAAWSYAKILSKTAKHLKLPINFHFVKSKNYGKLDKTYQSIYQFQNIICSFKDEKGDVYYFPVLEPYSELNDIRNDFQGVSCFSILQDNTGKRSHEFGTIPTFSEENLYTKEVSISLKEQNSDNNIFTLEEKLIFSGNVWLDIQPYILHGTQDNDFAYDNMKDFIENQVVPISEIDSVYNVEYEEQDNSFTITYKYDIELESDSKSKYISFKLGDFISNNFYTPLHLLNNRVKQGYLFNEYNVKYKIAVNLNGNYTWLENSLLKSQINNSLVDVQSNFINDADGLTASFELRYKQEEFAPNQWKEMLQVRDLSYDFLSANLYFKK